MKANTVRCTTGVALLGMILFGVYHCFFDRPEHKAVFRVEDAGLDTTFANPIGHHSDGYSRHISIRARGEADDSTRLVVTGILPTHRPFTLFTYSIPKGRFDTTWYEEHYEKKTDITFLHKKAKQGRLTVTFRYLSPDLDTLSE